MDNQTGWTASSQQGLIVLALLLVAIVAGQAEGDLPPQATAADGLEGSSSQPIILGVEHMKRLEKLPQMLETVLAAPHRLEVSIGLLSENGDEKQTDDAAESALKH